MRNKFLVFLKFKLIYFKTKKYCNDNLFAMKKIAKNKLCVKIKAVFFL